MHEQPAFNQENQDPDWKKVVIVWNGNLAKRNENEIFSKICSLLVVTQSDVAYIMITKFNVQH